MTIFQRILRTCLTCIMAVSISLSCFFAGNSVYNAVQARKAAQQQSELDQLYHQGASSSQSQGEGEMDPQLAALYAINPDLVGWLQLGGEGGFSAPVVQRDNSYYLKHDFYGQSDNHGAVFLDYRNKLNPNSENMIIYGHNMNDGTWFNYLVNYQNPDFVAQNPLITFNTLYEKGEYAVVAVFVAATLPQHGDDFDYHNKISFQTVEDKQAFLDRIAARSLLETGVEADLQDQLLTLSTCLYDFTGERLVVVARKLREGETAENFQNLTVTLAENPEMPPIWYELYG
jgi:sortase B